MTNKIPFLFLALLLSLSFSCSKQEENVQGRNKLQKIDLVLEDTIFQFTYDHLERIEKIVLPNQNYFLLTYNADNSLHTISLTDPNGDHVFFPQSILYEY